jgi:hypothetical protein
MMLAFSPRLEQVGEDCTRKETPMALFRVPLTDVLVKRWFAAILPLEEILIQGGTGVLTVFEDGHSIHYYLEVTGGSRPNTLSLGEVVVASGKDSAGTTVVPSGRLETVNAGTPAIFRGPY